MASSDTLVPVVLGFQPASVAIDDPDHPGLRRAGERTSAPYDGGNLEVHECPAVDLVESDLRPDLLELGFDVADLTGLDDLQAACARVRAAGRVEDGDAAAVRAALQGATLPLEGGHHVTVLHIAGEGFIMRTGGPAGRSLSEGRTTGPNGHGVATSVHGDQDVFGTPLRQLMEGRAPELFRHDSPDGRNDDARLMLVNFWIPLQQPVQPLVLADGRSIDRRRHQLRYGLPTGTFLERDDEMAINDIWTFLHDPSQRWCFRSEMDHRRAYVFDTCSTAHGAGTLPGEDVADAAWGALEAAEDAVEAGDAEALRDALATAGSLEAPAGTTAAIAAGIDAMAALIDEATADPEHVCGPGAEAWLEASRSVRGSLVRMSLELRLVVSIDDER